MTYNVFGGTLNLAQLHLIVTKKVTEFLLGMDFMCANDCECWYILIWEHSVPLVKCPHKANVCCVIV